MSFNMQILIAKRSRLCNFGLGKLNLKQIKNFSFYPPTDKNTLTTHKQKPTPTNAKQTHDDDACV